MSNPATELAIILRRWSSAVMKTNFQRRELNKTAGLKDQIQAFVLLEGVRREIATLKAAGRPVASFEKMWRALVTGTLALQSSWHNETDRAKDFPEDELDKLDVLASILDYQRPEAPGEVLDTRAVQTASELLAEVLAAVDEDESLSDRLRTNIKRSVRHLQTCIDEYETYGSSASLEALENAWMAMTAAAAESDDPTRWQKFANRFFWPTATGLLANAPSLALTMG